MADVQVLGRRPFGGTARRDAWWVQPLVVFLVLGASSCTRRGRRSRASTTRTALISRRSTRRSCSATRRTPWFGPKPAWWPGWLPFSPALLILWAPGGFRFTCYYYRGAYYKAFWADPPACAVGEPRKGYIGESSWPLDLQNIHRYFLYVALLFMLILAYDVWKAFWFADPATAQSTFGIGVGTLVLARQRRSAWPATRSAATRCGTSSAAGDDCAVGARRRATSCTTCVEPPERAAHAVGVDEPVLGDVRRHLRPAVLDGHLDGLRISVGPRDSPCAGRKSNRRPSDYRQDASDAIDTIDVDYQTTNTT